VVKINALVAIPKAANAFLYFHPTIPVPVPYSRKKTLKILLAYFDEANFNKT
jgi:hypothetical protein